MQIRIYHVAIIIGSTLIKTILNQLVECFKYLAFEQEADLLTRDLHDISQHDSSSEDDSMSVLNSSKDMNANSHENIYLTDKNKFVIIIMLSLFLRNVVANL